MIPYEKLTKVTDRYRALEIAMSEQAEAAPEEFVRLSKEYADLSPVVQAVHELEDLDRELADLAGLIADPDNDPEMRALAEAEMAELKDRQPELERRVTLLLLPRDEADEKNAILEVRAGTGGDEAALFAAELLRMYQRFVEINGWRFAILSASETDLGGLKEAIVEITGRGAFARLKFESGVHRVQRVPVTESGGRVHTSAATVAVLPEAADVDVEIDEKDLRTDVYRSSGPGGQSVNTTDSAVRITHLPSGIVVTQQDEKSQHKNRAKAMKVLRARLYELERTRRDAEWAAARRGQIGTGDRSERIRTYNYPQGRVTDHRINLTLYKLEQVLSGEALDEVVEALIAEHQAQRLAEIGEAAD